MTNTWHTRNSLHRALLLLGLLLLVPSTGMAKAPWVGVALGNASGGVAVTHVLPTSPAEKAGLVKGDLITHVGGVGVPSPGAFVGLTERARVGQTLQLTVLRQGRSRRVSLTVRARPAQAELIRLLLLRTPAPDFELPLVNQPGTLKLSSLRGKVVMLYFWASWCDSCKLNMKQLSSLLSAHGKAGLFIYSMGQDKRASSLKASAEELKLPFPVGFNDKNRVGLLYKSKNVPTLILVDRRGVIREYIQGSSFSLPALVTTIRGLLRESL